jgi:N-acetylneuraminic acid mutarotase
MPGKRAAHVLGSIGDTLYIAAGTGDRPQEVWSYDIAASRWRTDHAPLPRRIEHAAGLVHAGRLWIFGGRWSGEGEFRSVFAYDPARNAWDAGPDMPEARGGHAAAVVGGKAYILGGEKLATGSVDAEMLVFDFAQRRWSKAARQASPSIPRHGLAAAAAGNCLWIVGGGKEAGWRTFFTAADETEKLCP